MSNQTIRKWIKKLVLSQTRFYSMRYHWFIFVVTFPPLKFKDRVSKSTRINQSFIKNDISEMKSAMFRILLISVLSFLDVTRASSGEVMGCGGFVKSSKSNIDLSRIQVSLFEKRNSILRYDISTPRNCYVTKTDFM